MTTTGRGATTSTGSTAPHTATGHVGRLGWRLPTWCGGVDRLNCQACGRDFIRDSRGRIIKILADCRGCGIPAWTLVGQTPRCFVCLDNAKAAGR